MRYTIITVSYNSEATIERTLKSVLAQEVKDYEYIIVDGASKDSTMEIVKRYEPLFEGRMRWISEPDKGIYNAMNKGIAMAKGQLIGLVNSDDWLEPDTLERIEANIKALHIELSEPLIITGWMRFHYNDGSSQVIKRSNQMLDEGSKILQPMLNHPATWVTKTAYEKHGLFDERFKIAADSDLMLRMYFNGASFHYVDALLTNMSDGGASNDNIKQRFKESKLMIFKFKKSKLSRFYLILRWIIRNSVKILLPDILVRKIRK